MKTLSMKTLSMKTLGLKILGFSIIFTAWPLLAQQAVPTQDKAQELVPGSRFLNPDNPSPFEAMPGELLSEEIDLNTLTDQQRQKRDRNLRADELWKNADYRNYNKSFADLHNLSTSYTNNKYRLALSSYQSGVNTIIKMREQEELLRKESAEQTRLSEKWYWQLIDRRAREDRQIHNLRRRAKVQAVTYFARAIKSYG